MESEQVTPVDSIKDVVRSSMKVPEFDKYLKKAENVVVITIKMKTIVQKPLMIKNHQASSQKFRQLSFLVEDIIKIIQWFCIENLSK